MLAPPSHQSIVCGIHPTQSIHSTEIRSTTMVRRRRPLLAVTAAIAIAIVPAAAPAAAAAPSCPCANASWCQPIQDSHASSSTGLRPQEVFGFRDGGSLNADTKWRYYDWNRVTTVAWADPTIPELMCRAHAAGARVVMAAPNPLPINGSAAAGNGGGGDDDGSIIAAQALWVEGTVNRVQTAYLDGIVFDWEMPVDPVTDTAVTENYVRLINATRQALHAAMPGSQVSVCLAWSPNGIDGRWYPSLDLIDAADVAYVMMYDIRSQVRWVLGRPVCVCLRL